jgi:hypothetical protein
MTGSFEDAVAAVMRATELSPSDAFIWSMLARGFDLQFCRCHLRLKCAREQASRGAPGALGRRSMNPHLD